jgi:PAS domain S-box-containing protein
MYGAVVDITARKEAADALARGEERFRVQADAMPQMVWATDAQGNHLYYNRRWYEYTGQTVQESLGFGFALALHPDDYERTLERWRQAWQDGADYAIEYRFRRHDGEYRWFVGRAEPVRDPDTGQIKLWAGTCTDINDLKQAQEELERLYVQERTRAEREAVLARIGAAIRASLPPAEVQAIAVEALGQALGADRCYFATVDATHDQIVVGRDYCAQGIPPLAGTYRLSQFAVDIEQVFGGGKTLAVSDTQDAQEALAAGLPWNGQTAAVLAQMRVRSLINVPYRDAQGKLVAFLGVAMADAPRAWTDAEVAFAERVATETRSALEVVRQQQRERNIAQQLQSALQPSLPDPGAVPGLELGHQSRVALDEAEVGGDFYDVFPLEKGCTALVVGDVSGKGLAAAAQVATVRNMLRFALYNGRTLDEAIATLNHTLVENDLIEGFATLFVGCYDSGERTLTYVNCGQEPALLRRASTGQVEELGSTGPVLGGFAEQAQFEERVEVLSPGDVLAVFTDGLTAAGPSRADMIGVEGVASLLGQHTQDESASSLAERLVADVDAYAQGGIRDDVCLLVGIVKGT